MSETIAKTELTGEGVRPPLNGLPLHLRPISGNGVPAAKVLSAPAALGDRAKPKRKSESLGISGYLRLLKISRVIAMLALYLYLDQYDIHRKHHERRRLARLQRARELTRAAVFGEWLYALRLRV
jgi:hypothetical protein